MIKLLKNRSSFFKDSLTLISGLSLAQSIPFLISPILTRLYTPEEFGAYAIYIAITSILSVVATGRYEPAILLPKSERNADHVTALTILITFFFSLISLILVFFLNQEIVVALNVPEISSFLYLIPFSIFFLGLIKTYTYYLNRSKKYKSIAAAKLTQTSTLAVSQISLGFFGLTTSGLILGTFIGTVIGWFHLGFIGKLAKFNKTNYSLETIKEMGEKYKNFPKISAPHAFVNSISTRFPVFFLSSFFSSSIAGFFSLSMQVSLQPIKVIASALGQVFSRSITVKYNRGEDIHGFTKQTILKLAAIGAIPFIILIITAPELFELVFGSEWRVAGEFTQVLLPAYYLNFIVSPTVFISAMLDKQKEAFFIELIYLALRLAAISIGIALNSVYLTLTLYSIVGVIVQLYLILWILKISKENN